VNVDAVENVGEIGQRVETVQLGGFSDDHRTCEVSAPVSTPANNQFFRLWKPLPDRQNALFAGRDEGDRAWGRIAFLIATAKVNNVEPFAYLAAGPPANRIDDLLFLELPTGKLIPSAA